MRTSTWSNLGTEYETNDYKELLSKAGLDYTTVARDMYFEEDGQKIMIPDRKLLIRDDTKEQFGIVSGKYNICQNRDALDFVNCIPDVKLQKAGQIGGFVWMIGKLPEVKVLGDTISPNLIFQNSHDGSCSIKTTICMLRIACQNQFVSTFKDSPATISIRHNGCMDENLRIAKETMSGVYGYLQNYNDTAEELATQKVTPSKLNKIIEKYFVIPEDATERSVNTIMCKREQFLSAYAAEDNQNFIGTKWGVINAFSDYVTHETPSRLTDKWESNRFLWSLSPIAMDGFRKLVEEVA